MKVGLQRGVFAGDKSGAMLIRFTVRAVEKVGGNKFWMPFLQRPIMQTITKKELIDRIAEKSNHKRVLVKRIIQSFLDEI
ncbi:MAG: hypothetical protein GXY44_04200, partial [Phycisphaerales bacterium]|nr:hypothetical protein [Phycisphaerales bacterium]